MIISAAVRAMVNGEKVIIPCHRIIASNGDLGGYSAGVDKKEFLLKLEGTLK